MWHNRRMHTLQPPHAHPSTAACTPFNRRMQTLQPPHAHPSTAACTPFASFLIPRKCSALTCSPAKPLPFEKKNADLSQVMACILVVLPNAERVCEVTHGPLLHHCNQPSPLAHLCKHTLSHTHVHIHIYVYTYILVSSLLRLYY